MVNSASLSCAPVVSVIIPLYNAEKYIATCLESILAQNFQSYEVLVVDDCATDNSVAIVESYLPKFAKRLKLLRMEKNSGSGAVPRNKGLIFSRGEYVFFMDADDLIIPTALEEMYCLAEDYAADVVYCERYFVADPELKKIRFNRNLHGEPVEKPTLESENMAVRVQKILDKKFLETPWCKLVRRDLLLENEIFFRT